MIRADKFWTEQIVVTTAKSVTGLLGLKQRDTATTGRNLLQNDSYTSTVSNDIRMEEEIGLPKTGLSFPCVWAMLYLRSAG